MTVRFLTGPVTVAPAVHAAFAALPVSHRGAAFIGCMSRARTALASLVNASHVSLMVGSGTLANDAVAAQLTGIDGPGLVLANGEFGERLFDHARRWNLDCTVERRPWGEPFDWDEMQRSAERRRPAWIWAVLTETSTGAAIPLRELSELSERVGAALCLDAISAVGITPVDLSAVRFATAVSGKGLAALPGIAAVFHDGRLASPARIPRYLDLAAYEAANGVPFTHSSNLVAALECALSRTDWRRKFQRVGDHSRWLRAELQRRSLPPLMRQRDAAAGILTIEIPAAVRTADVAAALLERGFELAWQSQYLVERNWMQIALMGEIEDAAVHALPAALAGCVQRLTPRVARSRHRGEVLIAT